MAGIDGLHILSLDALLAVVDSIEGHCTSVGCSCASHLNICAQLKAVAPLSTTVARHFPTSAPPPTNGFMTGEMMAPLSSSAHVASSASLSSAFEIISARHSGAVPSSLTVAGATSGDSVGVSASSHHNCLRAWHGSLVDQLKCKTLPSPDALATRRRHKTILLAGIDQFNAEASKGIAFLQVF